MLSRLFRLYQRRRIININANIAFAGLASTAAVAALLWLMKRLGTAWSTWEYTAFSIVTDMVLDVSIFVALHWVANHWRPLRGENHREHLELAALPPPHVQDAAQVQLERAVISPLYYLLAGGGTEVLQRVGLTPWAAVAIAYPLGLLSTRIIHTIWGMKTGTYEDHHRREKKERIRRRRRERARGIRRQRRRARPQPESSSEPVEADQAPALESDPDQEPEMRDTPGEPAPHERSVP